ncbi:MAG: hypothetical protein A3H57_00870 [Candidatus Taylorbacteria bacterium RIFCSPLOWO2_02_FULL_43_11]|uniref:FAD-binding FR-type domain-containing protein n=1 Tax=Candidatus Taylorbacteria bacterium RIFCSPHIGHO2_02_FULL_43_32b TaxID=1802306 RepID=A0A1G2MKQ6_9BACT|nr:MAG: hypothetical protein A2743_03545 [Candidatus Taylorbacteria bacterium RIFCSPHIGHO2_01_FULL_43_47]OHA24510.1 MAG: hypothetical protein A3C72_00995 [Candidatus Taylorbacteria bacterium RIFCSPHIGHO2_02_FULL_43_32b]OHA31824.1 MAG: hypothetical protein A3B08_01290 [Candidatus Taylorbacteria bacterium RIFCSPLOWO2_01_FULL_43_44]OHA36704.1 MAG: hypothetical protein A3H57_00870 [Candidatus Taylorbacteria bacterium RIFCSPLOWO2_02_FULL_43_11]
MLKKIDHILNGITMYRLVLYVLMAHALLSYILSLLSIHPYRFLPMFVSSIVIVGACFIFNVLFSYLWKIPANIESVYITALIVFLIFAPPNNSLTIAFFGSAILVSFLAILSKFILVRHRRHIFNPAAIGFVLLYFFTGQTASWYVGGDWRLAVLTILCGFLVVRKIRRFDLVVPFFASVFALMFIISKGSGTDFLLMIWNSVIQSPLPFFAFIMLTEPFTAPASKRERILYGSFTGFLYGLTLILGTKYATPELALVIGNLFSFVISPKMRYLLTLKEKVAISKSTRELVFDSDKVINFKPGQYLEWNLNGNGADDRGNRRFFTIASSPTEKFIRLGVKFYERPSTFKSSLFLLKPGDKIFAGELSGDFILPSEKKKLAFVAGGIGITPFRSMLKYMSDTGQKWDVVLFYSNKTKDDIAYEEEINRYEKSVGVKVVHVLSFPHIAPLFIAERGPLDEEMIIKHCSDYRERIFYVSGPQAMVQSIKRKLIKMQLQLKQIKTDYFPGL